MIGGGGILVLPGGMVDDGGILELPGGMVEDDNGVLVTSDFVAGEDETEAKHKLQHGLHKRNHVQSYYMLTELKTFNASKTKDRKENRNIGLCRTLYCKVT
jgi:hypothetical protein